MSRNDPLLTNSTPLFDFEDPVVLKFIRDSGCYLESNIAKAVERLHDEVRDSIDYNVFNVPLHPGLTASEVISESAGFCLHKSILFVAGCRKLGVPAVLCSDVVTNHVADAAMLELVGGEEFLHWYTRIYLNGRWIKAAPIFNSLLCAIYGIDVLRFNPVGDSIEQRNSSSSKMTYSGQQRFYPNPSMDELIQVIHDKHPRMISGTGRTPASHTLTSATIAS